MISYIGSKECNTCLNAYTVYKTLHCNFATIHHIRIKIRHTLININFNSQSFNLYSNCMYVTCYYVLYKHELRFIVMIHTSDLYVFSLWFLPDDGPEGAETCT